MLVDASSVVHVIIVEDAVVDELITPEMTGGVVSPGVLHTPFVQPYVHAEVDVHEQSVFW